MSSGSPGESLFIDTQSRRLKKEKGETPEAVSERATAVCLSEAADQSALL